MEAYCGKVTNRGVHTYSLVISLYVKDDRIIILRQDPCQVCESEIGITEVGTDGRIDEFGVFYVLTEQSDHILLMRPHNNFGLL